MATTLSMARQPEPTRVIAITSGKGGVGKTTVSINLAVALAGMGRTVTLLDAIEEMVRQLDVPAMESQRTEFVALRFADAAQTSEALQVFYGPLASIQTTPGCGSSWAVLARRPLPSHSGPPNEEGTASRLSSR